MSKKKEEKEVATETVNREQGGQREEPAPTPPTPTVPLTSSQFLTADDILTSCGPPIAWEVPELPRNGKPSIVFIRQPSFDTMNSFWSSRKENENKEQDGGEIEGEIVTTATSKLRGRGDEASALMRFLFVQEDGTTPLFTDAQVSHIKEARFDVFQRLQEGVNLVVQPIMKGSSKETPNPFEEKEETN